MKRSLLIAAIVGLLLVGGAGYRAFRGDVGALSSSAPVPELPSLDETRWANGAPTSLASMKGEVVFVEGWSPG